MRTGENIAEKQNGRTLMVIKVKCPKCKTRFMKRTDHGVSMYGGIWIYHYTCRKCGFVCYSDGEKVS